MAGMPDWFIWTNGAELGHAVLAALGLMPLIVSAEAAAVLR